jgi:hypothetical protein
LHDHQIKLKSELCVTLYAGEEKSHTQVYMKKPPTVGRSAFSGCCCWVFSSFLSLSAMIKGSFSNTGAYLPAEAKGAS